MLQSARGCKALRLIPSPTAVSRSARVPIAFAGVVFDEIEHPCIAASISHYLAWCGDRNALQYGRNAHHCIVTYGFDGLSTLHCHLVLMYGNCEAVDDASKLFLVTADKDLESWNSFIHVLAKQGLYEEMLRCYGRMVEEGINPNRSTFMTMLSLRYGHISTEAGNCMHVFILEIGCENDVALGTAVLGMYGKSGSLANAMTVFNRMPVRNLVTWTAMISTCVQHSRGHEALYYFERMVHERVEPDSVTFVNLLMACSIEPMALQGQTIHDLVIHHGLEEDIRIMNALIKFYGKCGDLASAHKVFLSAQVKDVISWTSLMTAFAEHREHVEILSLFDFMQREGQAPNKVTFLSVVPLFDCPEALPAGHYIHSFIIRVGLDMDISISNCLLNMYIKCGCMIDALSTFDKMVDHNVITWTSIISIHADQGLVNEMLGAFMSMQQEGITPNKITFLHMLEACAICIARGNRYALHEGRCIHECIVCTSFELDISIETSLLKMYGSCSLSDAHHVFDHMINRDVVSWNTIIAVYLDCSDCSTVLQLFHLMQGQGVLPNEATYGFLIVACTSTASVSDGTEMHTRIVGSVVDPNVVTSTNIINMYSKCGHLENSRKMFDKIVTKNVYSWTAIISAYAENGSSSGALQLFAQMLHESVLPNEVTWISIITACDDELVEGKRIHASILPEGFKSGVSVGNAVINMYKKWGKISYAQQSFDSMLERNVVTWSAIVSMYSQNNQGNMALQHFRRMQENGVAPNDITFVSLLSACIDQAHLAEGERMHVFILENKIYLTTMVGNAIVNMYGKCGDIGAAWGNFHNMVNRDITTWNVMIGVCAEHGQCKEALELAVEMIHVNMIPDPETFINLLSACSHDGQMIDGWRCFVCLSRHCQTNSDHCTCVIDLFSRAGSLMEAEILAQHFPMQPTIMTFMSLLSCCRYQTDVVQGENAAKHVLELDIRSTAPFYMLKCIYGLAEEY